MGSPEPRIVYFHWTPGLITVRSSVGSKVLREPPHVVINAKNQIAALGQEAEAAAREPGMRLTRFPDVAAAWKERELAAAFLSYYWLTVELAELSRWGMLISAWWPSGRTHLVIHPAEGAERGLGTDEARWLRSAFRQSAPKRTYVWSGRMLDPRARLRDAVGGGRWLAGEPRLRHSS
jgi:hypothetical protein